MFNTHKAFESFHQHPTLHHPIHPHQHQQEQNHDRYQHPQHQPMSHTLPYNQHHHHQTNQHQHQQQQQQQQQQNQQQHQHQQQQQTYNMNSSDYSSSTYHIYDQISDLMIIKQQRMERKQQIKQKRKVMLIALAAILLVISLFLIFLISTSNSNTTPSVQKQDQATLPSIFKSPSDLSNQQQQQQTPFQQQYQPYQQQQYQPSIAVQLCAIQLNNCNGNGQCTSSGRCLCYPGFSGIQCEYPSNTVAPVSHHQSSKPFIPSSPVSIEQATRLLPKLTVQSQEQLQIQSQRLCASTLNNCHGNGHCTAQGRCKCLPGYSGDSCQERDLCFEQNCSFQGICQAETGACQCKFGFKGTRCEQRDTEILDRFFNCSSHGKFDYISRKCNCDQGYSGFDCSDESCHLVAKNAIDCGPDGLYDCKLARCICQDGYSGDRCQSQECSAQCLRNGQCINGACVCQEGFYGKHCSINGCPKKCNGRGSCVRVSDAVVQLQVQTNSQQHQEYRCQCQPGSMGDDCGLLVERQCDDNLDNDGDGLVDCADSECCSDKACQNSTLCMKSPDPLDTLMRKQPSPPTSSFFQRMQFLIERSSSQIYSNLKDFNDSNTASRYLDRASVIRGRVTYLKQGIVGVRVHVAGQINLGYTLSRDGGYFDLMVNGGGAVVIEFRREPFAARQKAVRVPWNEIVLMDPVELVLDSPDEQSSSSSSSSQSSSTIAIISANSNPMPEPDSPSCLVHNYRIMHPQIVPAPKSSRKSHSLSSTSSADSLISTSRAIILKESGTVQQSILLPGSSANNIEANQAISLIYISSRANEFMSTITLQLIPPLDQSQFKQLPKDLKLIHLKIVIEGNLFEQLFEPQTNLSFIYAWNRRNVYKQKSFGLSKASVSVGYEYFDCRHIIWTTKHIQLPGHDLPISDIGSQWNFNIHHRFNYRDSVLQRGDGQNFNLKTDKPRVVQNILGDGERRDPICNQCDGATNPLDQRLLKLQALVSAPDGSLYIGDHNLIRKIERLPSSKYLGSSEKIVKTVLELPISRVPTRYTLALNLLDQKLYMNDIDRNQIFLIKDQSKSNQLQSQQQQSSDSITNDTNGRSNISLEEMLIPVVGNGLRCQIEDRTNCGDEQAARLASLIEPKAMTFDLNGRMYIADGPNIRMVDTDGRIYTLLGDYARSRQSKFPCSGEPIAMHKFSPKAPIDLAMSPIDDTLHILDDNIVYKITQDKRVQIVAGRLGYCENGEDKRQLKATEVFLQSTQSITFNQNGELFISENDSKKGINRVLLVSPEENKISLYAGTPIDAMSLSAEHKSSIPNRPTVDSIHLVDSSEPDDAQSDKQRSSNVLPLNQATKATEYKFSSVSAIVVDQQGRLIIADEAQSRILSVEPDLPQINSAGEYELQSPDNEDELLVFNRNGYHIATREISTGQAQRQANKYAFSYDLNTAYGRLTSISYSTGNKISIYREGPQHTVKMIETALGGQCKLDISRNGQVNSISIISPNATKTNFSYQVDGGLLKQSRDQASGEQFEFSYDEFGRAIGIQHLSPKLPVPIECRVANSIRSPGGLCSSLII